MIGLKLLWPCDLYKFALLYAVLHAFISVYVCSLLKSFWILLWVVWGTILIKYLLQARLITSLPCLSQPSLSFRLLARPYLISFVRRSKCFTMIPPKNTDLKTAHFINAFIHFIVSFVYYFIVPFYLDGYKPTFSNNNSLSFFAELIMDSSQILITHQSISQHANLCVTISLFFFFWWVENPHRRSVWIQILNRNHVLHPSYVDVRPLALPTAAVNLIVFFFLDICYFSPLLLIILSKQSSRHVSVWKVYIRCSSLYNSTHTSL